MTSGATWAGRLARGLALTAATIAALTGVVPPPAHADTPIQLTLTMTSLTPSGSKPSDVVTARLTVTNTGTVPAYGVVAHLWRSRDAIHDQGGLATLAAGGTTLGGWAAGTGTHQLITTSTTAFEPGQVRDFTLSATIEQLGFDSANAAYAFGVDVVATADQSSNNSVVAKVRTFLPVSAKAAVPVTSLVVLSSAPTKLAPNVFANDNLSADLSGRLTALVDAASRPELSWLIDPALLDEVRDQADGYKVLDGGKLRDGTGQQAAVDWLARYGLLDPSHGARTLFGNPDTAGAAATDRAAVLEWSAAATQGVPEVAGLPLVVLPSGLTGNSSTMNFLKNSGASAVLATNSRVAGALQTTTSGTRVLSAQSISETQPADVTASIGQRQLLLAQSVIGGKSGQVRLITGLIGLAADSNARPGWIASRELDATLEATAHQGVEWEPVKEQRLSNAQLSVLDQLSSDLAVYRSLVPDSVLASQPAATSLRSVTFIWITDSAGRRRYADAVGDLFGREAVGDRVRLAVSSRLVMSARSNQFPVTISSSAFEPVRVRVEIATQNPQRLAVPPSEVVTVDPGQSQTINIRPEATGNGLVTGKAELVTADGHRVGDPVPVTIEVTDLGIVAWIIVGVSGAVLVGATAWRIRQVRRRDAAAESPAADSPTPDQPEPATPGPSASTEPTEEP
ncbi:MAG: DUF6049 family protein [Propionibacteriales bacterium]|nr:DUF6049 family protein [Propionibacteriales bacterium]